MSLTRPRAASSTAGAHRAGQGQDEVGVGQRRPGRARGRGPGRPRPPRGPPGCSGGRPPCTGAVSRGSRATCGRRAGLASSSPLSFIDPPPQPRPSRRSRLGPAAAASVCLLPVSHRKRRDASSPGSPHLRRRCARLRAEAIMRRTLAAILSAGLAGGGMQRERRGGFHRPHHGPHHHDHDGGDDHDRAHNHHHHHPAHDDDHHHDADDDDHHHPPRGVPGGGAGERPADGRRLRGGTPAASAPTR